MSKIINLNDVNSLLNLKEEVCNLDHSLERSLDNLLHETTDFNPADAIRVLDILGINSDQDPVVMNRMIHNSPRAFILRKKFFDTNISQGSLEVTLIEIISEMSKFIAANIVQAIVEFVKSMVKICAFKKSMTQYKELTFRFFTKGDEDLVVLLIINISYDEKQKHLSIAERLLNFFLNRVHLCMFASVVRTSFSLKNALPAPSSPSLAARPANAPETVLQTSLEWKH